MGALFREAYVDWAVEALVDGLDTPNLRILAGLQKPLIWGEVDHYFELALSELCIPIPGDEETVRSYLRDIAGDIVAGAIPPSEGCREVYRISVDLDYPDDLRPWLHLDDGLDPETYDDLMGPTLDAAILKEAARLLE